jgi:hypothetical protein
VTSGSDSGIVACGATRMQQSHLTTFRRLLRAHRERPNRRAAESRDELAPADADKKSKVIIVAVMQKMITTLNAILRDNAAWQPQSA